MVYAGLCASKHLPMTRSASAVSGPCAMRPASAVMWCVTFNLTKPGPPHAGTHHHARAGSGLEGEMLCVPRDILPALDDADDFYHADLIGLKAQAPDGVALGTVRAVHDFGAGDLLDIDGVFVPFTGIACRILILMRSITIILPVSDDEDLSEPDEEAAS